MATRNVGLGRVTDVGLGDGARETRHEVDVAVVDALGGLDHLLCLGCLGRGRERDAATSEAGGEDAITALFDGG